MTATNGGLNPRQQRFCECFVACGNATQAAKEAGYSDRTAYAQASRLLRNVKVDTRIRELQAAAAKRSEITADRVLQMLIDSYHDAKAAKQHGPAVRAAELLGKYLAMFVDRQITGEETLSREQIIEQLAEGDPERRKMARQLFNAPRNFEEGANQATRKLARST